MNFATKYRPTSFRQVVGQAAATEALLGLITQGLPNTILLCGQHSTGKTTLARLICLYVNCESPTEEGEPCRECSSCQAMLQVITGEGDHPDYDERNAAGKDERGIEMIQTLTSQAKYRPRYKRRCFVLDEAHMLTPQAMQAGLKLFEEPPSKSCLFILCTTNPEKLPITDLSRCMVFSLKDITPTDTARLLLRAARREQKELPKAVALRIAEAANGYPREALILLQQVFATFNGQEIDVQKLPAIIEKSDAVAPYLAVQRWLMAVIEGRYGNALLALQKSPSMDYFSKTAIETLRMMMHGWISEHLVDQSKRWMLKEVKTLPAKVGLAQLDLWVEVLGILLAAQEQVKRYQVDGIAAMELATYQIVAKVKAAEKEQ